MQSEFFKSQPYTPPEKALSLLVVDFDGTCSTADTSEIIARTAINAVVESVKAEEGEGPAQELQCQLESLLSHLVLNYSIKRDTMLDEALPPLEEQQEQERDEFDMVWLGEFMDRISEFDREMNTVVIDSGILAGVKKGLLTEAGKKITMQQGCLDLLQKAVALGVPTCVVSVNWSGELVSAALSQQGLPVVLADPMTTGAAIGGGAELQSPPLGTVMVYCNELEYFGERSTGNIKRKCECASDKGRLFDDLLLTLAAEGGCDFETAETPTYTAFIGDSMTDLSALISADVGIVVGMDPLIRRVASTAGVGISSLLAAPLEVGAGAMAEAPTIYVAPSWDDIDVFLFGERQIGIEAPPETSEVTTKEKGTPAMPPVQMQSKSESFKRSGSHASLSKGHSSSMTYNRSTSLQQAHPSIRIPKVLSIAGSDSSGGAGIQADLKTCMAMGSYCLTAVTALTAQNSHSVEAIQVTSPELVQHQIACVMKDFGPDVVVKTGMLAAPEIVRAIADELAAWGPPRLVVDPVLSSTSGDALGLMGVKEAMLRSLFPIATIVTPNIPEAQELLEGMLIIQDLDGMKAAAIQLHEQYDPQYVLIKGGHLESADNRIECGNGTSTTTKIVTDILYDGTSILELVSPYIATSNTHGTGCTLAAAIASELANGVDVPEAVRKARNYVWRTLERSRDLGLGSGVQRPMNHGWALHEYDANSRRIPNSIDLRLYAVTDALCNEKKGRSMVEAVQGAVKGGATVVQLRSKELGTRELVDQALALKEKCRDAKVTLLINDRVDVCLAVDADGVHVGQSDLPPAYVRKLLGPDKVLGVSVKSVEQAMEAEAAGADYLGVGALFPSQTKEDSSVVGVEGLKEIVAVVRIPVVGIGGIELKNIAQVVGKGKADGVAVVSALFGAEDVMLAAKEMKWRVDECIANTE